MSITALDTSALSHLLGYIAAEDIVILFLLGCTVLTARLSQSRIVTMCQCASLASYHVDMKATPIYTSKTILLSTMLKDASITLRLPSSPKHSAAILHKLETSQERVHNVTSLTAHLESYGCLAWFLKLTKLDLTYYYKSADILPMLSGIPKTVTDLTLDFVSKRMELIIPHLTSELVLSLPRSLAILKASIDDSGVQALPETITQLSVKYMGKSLDVFARLPHLRSLCVNSENAPLKNPDGFASLTYLNVHYWQNCKGTVARVSLPPKLRELRMPYHRVGIDFGVVAPERITMYIEKGFDVGVLRRAKSVHLTIYINRPYHRSLLNLLDAISPDVEEIVLALRTSNVNTYKEKIQNRGCCEWAPSASPVMPQEYHESENGYCGLVSTTFYDFSRFTKCISLTFWGNDMEAIRVYRLPPNLRSLETDHKPTSDSPLPKSLTALCMEIVELTGDEIRALPNLIELSCKYTGSVEPPMPYDHVTRSVSLYNSGPSVMVFRKKYRIDASDRSDGKSVKVAPPRKTRNGAIIHYI